MTFSGIYTLIFPKFINPALISPRNSRISYLSTWCLCWMFNRYLKLKKPSACMPLQTCSSSSIPHFSKWHSLVRPNILELTLTYLFLLSFIQHLVYQPILLAVNLNSFRNDSLLTIFTATTLVYYHLLTSSHLDYSTGLPVSTPVVLKRPPIHHSQQSNQNNPLKS